MTTTKPTGAERFESFLMTVILVAVGTMAGAASFKHVHDWTMIHSPDGTGDWFGWANAMITDLVPLGVGLEVRRRRRRHLPVGRYPIIVISCAAALSVAGQLAMAKPGISGWLLAAVPALGFLALTKLVLTRPTPTPASTMDNPAPIPPHHGPVPTTTPVSPALTVEPVQALTGPVTPEPVDVPAHLVPSARYAVTNHHQMTGQPITADELSARLSIPTDTAASLLTHLNGAVTRGGGR